MDLVPRSSAQAAQKKCGLKLLLKKLLRCTLILGENPFEFKDLRKEGLTSLERTHLCQSGEYA